ncbi:glucosamine-6-phosphate deaminase [Buchananella felis]|uniref:glucosamine-6-phosphate deaminase n=1 Tax=Buchananella felis TaxID=3231492 RepID=UPI00352922F9
MDVVIVPDDATIGALAADQYQKLLEAKPNAVIGLATGSSPLSTYAELIKRYQAGQISFAQATAFMLDEYVGIDPDHPERYRNVIHNEIASKVDLRPEAVHGPDGNAEDLEAACADYEAKIAAAGGVDLQILGIGSDGHIAFNEPGGSLASRTHLGVLTAQTRQDNARFFDGDLDKVPTHCLTQGLATIMSAKKLVLVAQGAGKAEAIRQLVEGGVSAKWPATIMQHHPDALVIVDEAAGSKLELADYYREVAKASGLV